MPPRSVAASWFATALAAAALAAGGADAKHHKTPHPPKTFDYYVLSLSWTPGFCATKWDPKECGKGKGFALHGLWPENENGSYPQNCPGPSLTAAQKSHYQDLFASPDLINHEWPKHGTCSGLGVDGYFALVLKDVTHVVIPPPYATDVQVKAGDAPVVLAALRSANPGLPADGLKAQTSGAQLTEVRICLTKAGDFRSCGATH